MKIYQFTPASTLRDAKVAEKNGPKGSEDFASFLNKATASSAPVESAEGPGQIISMENMRALSLPSTGDLGMAGKLLKRVEAALRSTSIETLEKVHNLEGLLYIHNKNNS